MKEQVKVSVVQFAPEWLKTEKNANRMRDFTLEEANGGAELIVFPELSNVGYITPILPGMQASFDSKTTALEFAVKYIKASEPVPGPTTDLLSEVAMDKGVYIVVGISQLHPVIPSTLYNSAVLIGPSGIIGVDHKVHIPLHEKNYFYPGGMPGVYRTGLGNIAMTICYDARFPELARIQGIRGAEVVCWTSAVARKATPVEGEKFVDIHNTLHRAYIRAQENLNYFLGCNRTGQEGDFVFMGRSAIGGPLGEVIAFCDSEEEVVLRATLYDKEIVKARALFRQFGDRRPELYGPVVEPISEGGDI